MYSNLQYMCEALGGSWRSDGNGSAPCPVCQPEGRRDQVALSMRYGSTTGKPTMNCHRLGCSWQSLTRELARLRLWPVPTLSLEELEALKRRNESREAETRKFAQSLWDMAKPIGGTPGEAYLRTRGIDCLLPPSMRFTFSAWHSGAQAVYPAIISRLRMEDGIALHRTYLDVLGTGKAAIQDNKKMLGSVLGGAVVLAENSRKVLAVTEGIETGLSLCSGHLAARFGPMTVVAALSAGGMGRLGIPNAPTGGQLVIASDGDTAGSESAGKLAVFAQSLGWNVHHAPAPDGMDWNDVLRSAAR